MVLVVKDFSVLEQRSAINPDPGDLSVPPNLETGGRGLDSRPPLIFALGTG